MLPLSSLKPGQQAIITRLPADEQLAMRLREMGLLLGTTVTFIRSAPLKRQGLCNSGRDQRGNHGRSKADTPPGPLLKVGKVCKFVPH